MSSAMSSAMVDALMDGNVIVDAVLLDYAGQTTLSIPQIPRPISTVLLAKKATPLLQTTGRGPGRDFCVICQYHIEKRRGQWSVLPCEHTFHSRCLYGLSTVPSTGATSALSCPLCRSAIHRDTLQWMGLPVTVGDIVRGMHRCQSLALILGGTARTETALYELLRGMRNLETGDGFIRSACTLHVERAIFHKTQLATQLHNMAQTRSDDDLYELYQISIACHVEVLIAVRHAL